ncbi:UvrD-helicase domain-containing protein [Granulicoccus phenolivorans]|uniref:UvrD-helicase domain-containing protein n=1 Tax=Granulicoccus phenolivorans TaxID=266854 RepID=UPI0003F9A13B|nr:ATP-dependent helicase [Granulicoccus phenolivorans]
MPLILDELDTDAATGPATSMNPKFFSSKLTGVGKKTGLLNETLRPVNTVTKYAVAADLEVKQSTTQHDVTTTTVPLGPVTARTLRSGGRFTVPVPHPDDRFTVAVAPGGVQDRELSFDMTPQALVLWEDKAGDRTVRDVVVQYRMEVHVLRRGRPEPERAAVVLPPGRTRGPQDAEAFVCWETGPVEHARTFLEVVLTHTGVRAANLDDLADWLENYSVYERIARLAEIWSTEAIAAEIGHVIAALPPDPTEDQQQLLAAQLRYLENYGVSLEAYRTIHRQLAAAFPDATTARLAKQNLNLLMNHTLNELAQATGQLVTPPSPPVPPVLPGHLSQQQLRAITTAAPLALIQAGAGSGKSHTILHRITYLEACGVPSGDITVLSFTNAAADNITAKNPDVGSMTIARMIIEIYALNHPTHQVSAVETLVNSLDIFFPSSAFAATFRACLLAVENKKVGAFTELNSFVEAHFDEVVTVLDRIRQTTLELQIILCYQRIDTMAEPPRVRSRYLIIDEVQDTSVFEFIYLIKYVTKHRQSLFLVGDASQTLYEFRSANPRALNTLERSEVFATYRLTTNYRSNQEILDFANAVLGGLETNRFANIQLQANALAVPTEQSFREKVTLDYRGLARVKGFLSTDLPLILRNTILPTYVRPRLERGEQVAFLAFSRREVTTIQRILEETYPDKKVVSLVSERAYATDVFSTYVRLFWNDVRQVRPGDAAFVVSQGIQHNLAKLTRHGQDPKTEKAVLLTLAEWWTQNQATVTGWVTLCRQHALSDDAFFDRLRQNLLDFEIAKNQQKLNVTQHRNQERKKRNLESRPDLVVSTIHGAKGLEFDHVVVLYNTGTAAQADLRMYYVAFTRAMHSEYVLAYGTTRKPAIESDYAAIVARLAARDRATALRAQGIDPDLLTGSADDAAAGDPALEPAGTR